MKIMRSSLLLVAVLAITSHAAYAVEKVYIFNLSGAAEVPAVATPGTGFAKATFDLDLSTMHVEANFSDLLGTTTASHVHCCDFAANTNAGVATTTPTFTGFPLGVTSGTYDHTFDMTLASSYRPAYLTAHGNSTALALSDLLANLDNGKAYFNIHTNLHPGGEIRGQAIFVPEPTTVILSLLGLGMPFVLRRTR